MKAFLSINEVSERYGISRVTVYNWIRQGVLPKGLRIGGIHRWAISELEEFEQELAHE